MTMLITADWHLNDNPRDFYRHQWQKQLRDFLRLNKVDHLIILGDLTDEKDRHSAWLVNKVVSHVYELSRLVPQVIILKGNHDYAEEDSPFFEFSDMMEGVRYISSPLDLDGFLFLPHTNDYKNAWDGYRLSGRWIFAHNTFEGTKVGGRTLKGIPTNIFGSKTRVVSGDIHEPQDVGCVTYVGAPYTTHFGDEYEPRMLLLDKDKLKSIPCTGPQKRLLECKIGQPLPKRLDFDKGDILKVRVEIEPHHYAKWPEFVDEVRAWGDKHQYVINMVQPVVSKAMLSMSKSEAQASAPKSDRELFQEYAKSRGIDDRTVRVGLRLLEEE